MMRHPSLKPALLLLLWWKGIFFGLHTMDPFAATKKSNRSDQNLGRIIIDAGLSALMDTRVSDGM